ncbi:MAG: DNA polymerase III subunit gamma/tau, partial [Pseudomonadota bacterium]
AETALRMVVLRLVTAARLPSPEDAARLFAAKADQGGATGAAGKSESQGAVATEAISKQPPADHQNAQASVPAAYSTLDHILSGLEVRKEIRLWSEVRQFIRAEKVRPGTLICDLKAGAPDDLLQRLKAFLDEETLAEWSVSRAKSVEETQRERETREKQEQIDEAAKLPEVMAALAALPGAEIVDVTTDTPVDPEATEDNVIPLKRRV